MHKLRSVRSGRSIGSVGSLGSVSLASWVSLLALVAGCGGGAATTTGAGGSGNTGNTGTGGLGGEGATGGAGATGGVGGEGGTSLCGNATIDTGEDCDGAQVGGITCVTLGFDGGLLGCTAECTFDTTACTLETCGNGMLDAGEDCEGLDVAGANCVDLGFNGGDLACNPNCTFDTSACTVTSCGDGVVNQPGEQCDGNDFAGVQCTDLGFTGGALACTNGCTIDTSGCGNENCYDAGDNDGDGLADCADPDCATACANPCAGRPVLGDPASVAGSTAGHADTYASCSLAGGEVVYEVQVAQSGMLDVTVTSAADLGVAVLTSCLAGELGCADQQGAGGDESLSVPVTAGQTVFVMVDGPAGSFTLDVGSRPIVCGDGLLEPGEACDDGNVTDGDGCTSGCLFDCASLVCSDGNACTNEACDALIGCYSLGNVDPSDGDACTIDTCDPGSGPVHTGGTQYLYEDFVDASGWTIGQDWQVGQAVSSDSGVADTYDPDFDVTGDGQVAGVVLGGNVPLVDHGFYYLESPAVNTSGASGTLVLEYWRWLNSDYTTFMNNVVEVYDGSTWVQVWQSGSSPPVFDSPAGGSGAPNGPGWVKMQHDVSAYAGPNFRARFGFEVGQASGAYTVGGWNLDGVSVYSQATGLDASQCTEDTCDSSLGGVSTPKTYTDFGACYSVASCDATEQIVTYSTDAGSNVAYFTDFSSSVGWTLGTEWQIGMATASPPATGAGDPARDHTINTNDMIAGAAIGGNVSTILHDYYWLTSPVINTAAAGTVTLSFWRRLNTDYVPYMNSRLQAWNGSAWVTVWENGNTGVFDDRWVYVTYDLTPYKNAGMQLRWGHNVTQGGVFTVGGWNIDDVLVRTNCTP